ncbi:hypothetical protein AABB24_031323 [Solanum stoloniferum]|uniref:Non-specific lipid-transfer protein n=1 Tax=Solanum stoloniferum TaxID=62892 RepID=A0ABD2RTI4_9SOLN
MYKYLKSSLSFPQQKYFQVPIEAMASYSNLLSPKKSLNLLLICTVLAAALPVEALLSCSTVFSSLEGCATYIVLGGRPVPPKCCSGLKSLISTAKTIPDRKSFCSCIKGVAYSATPEELARAAGLSRRCHARVPFKISPDVDCSKVK